GEGDRDEGLAGEDAALGLERERVGGVGGRTWIGDAMLRVEARRREGGIVDGVVAEESVARWDPAAVPEGEEEDRFVVGRAIALDEGAALGDRGQPHFERRRSEPEGARHRFLGTRLRLAETCFRLGQAPRALRRALLGERGGFFAGL